MYNYERGRAFALANSSQECLHNSELFKAWVDQFMMAMSTQAPAAPNKVVIYTDGACSGNPGPGGWGAVLMVGNHRKEFSGAMPEATNNRMELLAAINALALLKKPCMVELHSDSSYLVNAFVNNWVSNWQKNGWKNSQRQPVLNQDLWEQLIALTARHHVTFIKVKGHVDNELNNRCDELAVAAIKQLAVTADA